MASREYHATVCRIKFLLLLTVLGVAEIQHLRQDVSFHAARISTISASRAGASDRGCGNSLEACTYFQKRMQRTARRLAAIIARPNVHRWLRSLGKQEGAVKTAGIRREPASRSAEQMQWSEVDKFVDTLMGRALGTSFHKAAPLESSTLGKAGKPFAAPAPATARRLRLSLHRQRFAHHQAHALRGIAEPVDSLSQKLSTSLDLGKAFKQEEVLDGVDRNVLSLLEGLESNSYENPIKTAENVEAAVLDSIGHDVLIFLSCASVATPLARIARVTPIFVYLFFGAILGPHGLDVFISSEADVELGDIGVLFLLFAEGLEVSSERFGQLAAFLPLGTAQISMTAGALSLGISQMMPVLERFLPLDNKLINTDSAGEMLIIALAGTLSTSAFVFPVLQERRWEEQVVGKAATSILLLQDLFVAPLLVLLPFIVGQSTNIADISELTIKATIGFGTVLVVGSYILRNFYEVVAATRSTDTFVAFSLLVSVGMGVVAKKLGLTETVGAFAAGVLLANTNYKYEISASVLPFKGILLGVFFLDAGSNFDLDVVLREFPTIATGVTSLLLLKAFTLGLAGAMDRALFPGSNTSLSPLDNARLAILLAGGGEFAFVVLKAAEKLGALPSELNSLLTSIILITMSLTPQLGNAAAAVSDMLSRHQAQETGEALPQASEKEGERVRVASDAIVICGYGEVGSSVGDAILAAAEVAAGSLAAGTKDRVEPLRMLAGDAAALTDSAQPKGKAMNDSEAGSMADAKVAGTASIACFDLNAERVARGVKSPNGVMVMYGDGSNAELLRLVGITAPRAIIITYPEFKISLSTTQRLHTAFPNAPIYARATSLQEREALVAAGASATVMETQELAVQLGACLFLDETVKLRESMQTEMETGNQLTVQEKARRALRTVVGRSSTTTQPS